MHELSTLELSILAKELKEYNDYFIEKFYDLGESKFRLKIRNKEKEANLVCFLCHTIGKTSQIEKSDFPSNFCMAVRKRITNSRIKNIYQLNNDRIIVFALQKDNSELNMIFEMFGKGNLIITDSSMKIMLAYMQHSFKDREIKVNSIYKNPTGPSKQFDLKEINAEIKKQKKPFISYLSSFLNIGPIYIEDALIRLNIPTKTLCSEMQSDKIKEVVKIIEKIEKTASNNLIVYTQDGKTVDYSIIELKKYPDLDKKEFNSMQEALDFVYSSYSEEKIIVNPEIKRLEASIEKQRTLLSSLQDEIEKNKKIGQTLFEHMNEVNELINKARANKKITVEELQTAFPGFKIKNINLKDKTLTVDM